MQREERFNSFSHLVGAILGIAGTVVLIVLGALKGDPWRIVSFTIYGVALALLYVFSSLYHAASGRAKRVLQKFDHVAIYPLIAGTYMPFVFGPLRGPWGWSLFGILWGLTILGIIQEFVPQRTRALSLIIYVVMGWLILIAAGQLMASFPPRGVLWLAAGGLLYSIGVVFFVFDERWRYGHEIWHVFVLAGSIAQYGAVLFYIALTPVRF